MGRGADLADGVVGEQEERPRTRQFSVGWEADPPGEHLLLLEYILIYPNSKIYSGSVIYFD